MKKICNRVLVILMALVTSLSFVACDDDDLSTNQYSGGISLNAYGPNPVTRGGTLRFVGSNLDQISYITIPGVSENITDIEIKSSGIPSEIRITVPKEGPEPGKITLTAKSGEILTTEQEVTYEEGVEFESFSPAEVMPGDELTITGEYLNLVEMIEFADEVWVGSEDFVSHDRYTITVIVPDSAQTGQISLYTANLIGVENSDDLSYEIFTSEESLVVGTATVSTIASTRTEAVEALGTVTVKAGEAITITGTDFNLIAGVKVIDASNDEYEIEEFTINEEKTQITFTLPTEVPDGDIYLVALSGVEIEAGVLSTVKPSNIVLSPLPVKNGAELTITGDDIDLVSYVTLPNVSDGIAVEVSEESTITITVPDLAQAGDLVLYMVNGQSVTAALTLVDPAVTEYSANPANAGGALTITGTDLDLVASVQFNGATETATPSAQSETSLTVTVPMSASTGSVVFNLKNGTTVTVTSITIEAAVFCYVTEMITREEAVEPGVNVTLPVTNGDKLTSIEVNGIACDFLYNSTASTITFVIPTEAVEYSPLRMVSSNGEYTTTLPVDIITEYDLTPCCVNQSDQSVVMTFPFTMAWADSGRFRLNRGMDPAIESMSYTAGVSVIKFHVTGTGQLQINDPNWSAWTTLAEWSDASEKDMELVLTQDMIDYLVGTKSDGWSNTAIIVQGDGFVISGVTLIP